MLIRFVSRFTVYLCNAIYFSTIFSISCKQFTKILHFAFWDLNRAKRSCGLGLKARCCVLVVYTWRRTVYTFNVQTFTACWPDRTPIRLTRRAALHADHVTYGTESDPAICICGGGASSELNTGLIATVHCTYCPVFTPVLNKSYTN